MHFHDKVSVRLCLHALSWANASSRAQTYPTAVLGTEDSLRVSGGRKKHTHIHTHGGPNGLITRECVIQQQGQTGKSQKDIQEWRTAIIQEVTDPTDRHQRGRTSPVPRSQRFGPLVREESSVRQAPAASCPRALVQGFQLTGSSASWVEHDVLHRW